MTLLRLFGFILVYTGIGFGLHYAFTQNTRSLIIALVLFIFGILLLFITRDSSRRTRCDSEDWFDILDLIEIPFELLGLLFRFIARIFD